MKKIILLSMVQIILIGTSQSILAMNPDDICQNTVNIIKQAVSTQATTRSTSKNKYYDVIINGIQDDTMTIDFTVSGVSADTPEKAKAEVNTAILTLRFKSSTNFPQAHQIGCNYQLDFKNNDNYDNKPTAWAYVSNVP